MVALTKKLPFNVFISTNYPVIKRGKVTFFSIGTYSTHISTRPVSTTRNHPAHLPNSIIVNDYYNPASTKPLKIERLISQTPGLAHHVKSLIYTVKKEDLTTRGFAAALGRLTNLESLTVELDWMEWKDMPFRKTILNLMRLPTLSHLKLCYVHGFSVSDLTLCTGLKSLETATFWSVKEGKDLKRYQQQPPRLESYAGGPFSSGGLSMQLCTARRADGKPIVDITGLKKLSIGVTDDDLNAIKEWFKVCTQLTDVHLTSTLLDFEHEDFSYLNDLIDTLILSGHTPLANLFLPSLQTLQHLHLELDLEDDEEPLRPLIFELASLAGKNVIESIKLSIVVRIGANCDVGDVWGALGRMFIQTGWEDLRSFSLNIQVDYGLDYKPIVVDDLVQRLQNLPKTQLKGLAVSKHFRFDFDVSTCQTYG